MTLTPEIISLLALDAIFFFFSLIAFILSVKIYFKWNITSTDVLQYELEKQSYLVSVIIKYIFFLKLPLFLFFIFTCDKLSAIITGAMCAAGVINSVYYGLYLIVFKMLNLYLFGFWLLLHRKDTLNEAQPYVKVKFLFFALAFFFFMTEIILEISFFASLNISKIVSCCGTLFSATSTSYLSLLFKIDTSLLLCFFYGSFLMLFIAYFLKNRRLFIVSNGLFLLFSITSLIVFFSTYVYELPTHNCPFCLLQLDYYGIGYVLYISLFIGTFYGFCGVLLEHLTQTPSSSSLTYSLLFNTLYVLLVTLYPLSYYLKNGVWL
jgi:hypothetical protein